jgi:acid stress-induced BolA-like protein IbaG/YrbA
MGAHHTSMSTQDTLAAIKARVGDAIPGCRVAVEGGGGHYTIEVVSDAFEGLTTLKKQRMVYRAIKELMAGDDAPVHAVDSLKTLTTAEAA